MTEPTPLDDDSDVVDTETEATETSSDNDDDDESPNDRIIHEDEETGIVQQDDGNEGVRIFLWEIAGLYQDNGHGERGRVKTRWELYRDPPVLSISDREQLDDEDDDEYYQRAASFILTRDMARSLSKHTHDVYKAYHGVKPDSRGSFSQETFKHKMEQLQQSALDHKIRTGIIVGIVVLLLLSTFGIL